MEETNVQAERGHSYYFIINFTSSSIASAISKTATAPLERVKLILQTGTLHAADPSTKNFGIFRVLKYIVNEQGISGLWRGNVITVTKAVPAQGLVFGFHDFYKRLLFSNDPNISLNRNTLNNLVAGGLGSGTVIAITYPFYFCQNIISSYVGNVKFARFSGVSGCITDTKKNVSAAGLYRGFCATSVSVVINRALYFGSYEFLKDSRSSDLSRWTSAQMASLIASVASYPFETVGRLMILDVFIDHQRKKSVWIYVKDIYQKNGMIAFFGGFYTNILRSFGGAILMIIHEDISKLIFRLSDR